MQRLETYRFTCSQCGKTQEVQYWRDTEVPVDDYRSSVEWMLMDNHDWIRLKKEKKDTNLFFDNRFFCSLDCLAEAITGILPHKVEEVIRYGMIGKDVETPERQKLFLDAIAKAANEWTP